MDLSYSEEQVMLRDSVDRYGADTWPAASRQAMLHGDPADARRRWRDMAELGWLMLPIAEGRGGLGGGGAEVMAVMEGIGRHLMVTPYASACVLVSALLAEPGDPADELLAAIGAGEMIAAAALLEADGGYALDHVATTATAGRAGWVLNGAKIQVEDGADADRFIVSARTAGNPGDAGGIGLFLIDRDAAGLTVDRFRSIDGHRHARLRFDDVSAVALDDGDTALARIEAAVDRAIAAQAAEATGSMEAAAGATLDYLKTRQQFGVAIGTFQALQHRMVDMTLACEEARAMACHATLHLEAAPGVRRRAAAAAKVRVGESGLFVGQQAVQLHGGVGFSDELIVSHHLRRQMMLAIAHGSIDHHRARFAAETPVHDA